MDLSTIIVSYNVKELLIECLKSVNLASKDLKSEIFVVDNNSQDHTVGEVKKNFPQINLIANKKNLGFSKANNQAIKKARGKYLLVLNPDTKVMPDALSKMKLFMDKNQRVAVSTCRVELEDGSLDRDCRRQFPNPWRSLSHFSGISKLFRGSKIFDQYYMGYISDKEEHEIDACAGAFMMVRKSDIEKVGLFDEDFFFYGEDLDWCWRFKEAGYKIVYTPITKIIHYKGVSSGIKLKSQHLTKATKESKVRALKESTRAMRLFYEKHYMNQYPFFINLPVSLGIHLVEKVRLLKA